MTLKNEPRREPSLADLEAFDRLLRDSLKADGLEPAAVPLQPAPSAQPAITADSAMAEFNRLVEAPVVFEAPGEPPSVSRISAIEQALRSDLDKPPQLVPAPPSEAAPPLGRDPLLDFEEELRRFEAMSRPPVPVDPVEPLRAEYAGDARIPYRQGWSHSGQAASQGGRAPQPQEIIAPESAASHAHHALAAAENRLHAEAEAAALAGGAALAAGAKRGTGRSRRIFLALGGVAVAGLVAIGGITFFSGGSKRQIASGGNVPVVAAKPEPAKERPANPGGLEVPDQNKQVLAARNAPATDSRPAQVVNQTEQPVDLNQIARRDGVRIVAPSPFQGPPNTATPGIDSPPPGVTLPGTTPAPAPGEPRRVQSVRIADPVTPPPAVTPSATPGIGTGTIAGIATGAAASAPAARPQAPMTLPQAPATLPQAPATLPQAPTTLPPGAQAAIRPTPSGNLPPVVAPPPPPPPRPAVTPAEDNGPKVEARPQSPVAPARPQTASPAPPRPAANAPLPLVNTNRPASPPANAATPTGPAARVATAPAAGAGGAFAIQLASRPSEADAQNASRQLGQRFAGQIGGKSPVVVRGESNGQTVYRVRVTGFAQADATAACDRIRAAGGACFVARQ
ncbi:MAG: SPOR domain-containing protein [Methylobacterium sp.]|nr:SPOR domain-containing protein [Methylobacterium sp.]